MKVLVILLSSLMLCSAQIGQIPPEVPTCTTSTATNTIPFRTCIFPGQVLTSCNGQYKAMIYGNYPIAGFKSSDLNNPIYMTPSIFTPVGGVCAGNQKSSPYTMFSSMFAWSTDESNMDTYSFGPYGPFPIDNYKPGQSYDIKLADDGRLVFIDNATGALTTYGVTCIVNYFKLDDCITEGQTRYTCDNCFKLTFQNGNLTVFATHDLTKPIWVSKTSSLGAVKACMKSSGIVFYNAANVALTPNGMSYNLGNNGASLIAQLAGSSVVNGVSPNYVILSWPKANACRDRLYVPVF